MGKFNFNSAICTSRIQSERLLALGLKKETADMAHAKSIVIPRYKVLQVNDWDILTEYEESTFFPAWSLHRLIEMCDINPFIFYTNCGYDNVVDRIEELIKEGYFNKEYLV